MKVAIEIGKTYRVPGSRERVTYDPEFCSLLPWKIVLNGTVVARKATLADAQRYLRYFGRWE